MKQSEFDYLIKQNEFKAGFRGAFAMLVTEIIDQNTAEGKDITSIDGFENKRRTWAYDMAAQSPAYCEKYIPGLRALFPVAESEVAFYPFNMDLSNEQKATYGGAPDIDEVENVLFTRIKEKGYINAWAKALPEDRGKKYNPTTKQFE